MTVSGGNFFASLPDASNGEVVQALLERSDLRIERIVSRGQVTGWCVQEWDEWVLLLAGSARLECAGEETVREMSPGDYLCIPSGCRHRVAWTEEDKVTVWLAIHYDR